MTNATRVKAALRLTHEDTATINVLKKEVDKAWKLVETGKSHESKSRKQIETLKSEIAHLNSIIHGGTGLPSPSDTIIEELNKVKENL